MLNAFQVEACTFNRMKEAPLKKLAHYRLVSRLGAGGMGEVYLAEDTRLGRKVALKILPAEFVADADRVRRFEQEARAVSALNHPNILVIYEIGKERGVHFIATEFIEGQTLRQKLDAEKLKVWETLDLAVQIAEALQAAHATGIVHRDIKPENIMLRPDGYVKVLDFGLAKLNETRNAEHGTRNEESTVSDIHRSSFRDHPFTNPGTVMGTAHYMSPEQARGLKVDARSDIFSFGIVLYEMLAGQKPFTGQTMSDVLAAILRAEPPPLSQSVPSLPAELDRCIAKALYKDCNARYQTISELLNDLKRLRQRLDFEDQATVILDSSANLTATTRISSAPRKTRLRKTIDSLAVLPLINASRDANLEYLSDGITESIINTLSQLPKLRVVPRSTVFRYKGKSVDPQEAGEELGVRAVFAGRIVQVRDAIILKAELIDVAQQSQLWGEQYRHKNKDIFALETEISADISEKLRLRLSGAEKKKLVKRYTENTEAYHLYLKGRYFTNKRTNAWIKKGIEHFQQAIDLDPNYALAYAGLADAYSFLASSTGGQPPREVYPKAEAAALQALELDDTLGEAHSTLGFCRLLFDWDFAAAEREYKRAIELSPNYANAHDGYSFYLKATGQHEAAIKACERAQALDPLSMFATLSLGWAYYFARDYDRALMQARKVLDMDANFGFAHWHAGKTYLQKGMFAEAVASLRQALNLIGGTPPFIAFLGHAYARAGKHREARQMLTQLQRLSHKQYVSSYFLAIIHLGLGEMDETFAWLEQAYEERSGFLAFLGVEPMLDELRGDARFANLLQRVGLPCD
jgi:serine/threonine protein kinase/Flp pilus assembly protein TadD